jgi:hypothetical protein
MIASRKPVGRGRLPPLPKAVPAPPFRFLPCGLRLVSISHPLTARRNAFAVRRAATLACRQDGSVRAANNDTPTSRPALVITPRFRCLRTGAACAKVSMLSLGSGIGPPSARRQPSRGVHSCGSEGATRAIQHTRRAAHRPSRRSC